MLILEQPTPEIANKVLQTLTKLIANDKLNKFDPKNYLEEYLELTNELYLKIIIAVLRG